MHDPIDPQLEQDFRCVRHVLGVPKDCVAHCRSLDPDAPSARERLTEAVGVELAAKLVVALSSASPRQRFAA